MAEGALAFLNVNISPNHLEQFPQLYATSQRFSSGKPRTFQITDDDSSVLFCRAQNRDDPTLCLWRFDTTSGTEHLLVNPRDLQLEGSELSAAEQQRRERARESGGGIVSYRLSSTGHVCFVLGQALYLLDIQTEQLQELQTETPVFDPRFSPDGSHIGYVHGTDVRVVTPSLPKSDRLVFQSPAADISIGRADFIAAEEIGRSRGFWWSPDSRLLVAAEVNESEVQQWWISQPSQPDAAPRPLRYPPAGGTNSTTRLLVGSVETHSTETVTDPVEMSPFEYLVGVNWTDHNGPLISRQSRNQREVTISRLDVSTGQIIDLRSVTDDAWVDIVTGAPCETTAGLLTIENRRVTEDPAIYENQAIYKALCIDGEAITSPEFDIRSVLSINESDESNPVAVVSIWAPPKSQTLAFVDLVTGTVRRVGPNSRINSGVFSKSTSVITETSSSLPGATSTINQIVGGTLQPVHTIKSFHHTAGFEINPTWISIDDGAIEVAVFLPDDHDGQSSLPVLMDPYGGPHARRVADTHDGHLVSQWFANHGYAVVVADGVGTPGRGVHREHQVWGDLATPVLNDQVQALDTVADRFGFLDLDKVAIRGWSFGGYLAALAVLARPDRFHCAISGAPVTSWHLYDTHYTERYLGHPGTYPEHYEQTDLLHLAENLPQDHPHRPLLLIHGLADDNVVAAHSLQLSTALVGSGYPHQVLPLSGVTHMTPQAVVAENLLRLQLDFLTKATQS